MSLNIKNTNFINNIAAFDGNFTLNNIECISKKMRVVQYMIVVVINVVVFVNVL